MIYEFPPADAAIRQGDIFVGLPRVDVPLTKLTVVGEGEDLETDWDWVVQAGKPIVAMLPVRPVAAIVITQDCDALRAPDISLCEIRPFPEVEGKAAQTKDAKGWMSIITQQARLNLKWFYLPPDARIGFTQKMAVDFRVVLRVPGPELEGRRILRAGRLIPEADEHFRERLSEFFRRYPYDEWYPLNAEEFQAYRSRYNASEPRPWQVQEPLGQPKARP